MKKLIIVFLSILTTSAFAANQGYSLKDSSGNLSVNKVTANANMDVKNGDTSSGILAIYEDSNDGTNNATFTVPALTADTDYTLPSDDGDSGEYLKSDGSGGLSWDTPAGAGDITAVGDVDTGAAFNGTQGTTLTFYNVEGNATIDYDGTDVSFSKTIETSEDVTITGSDLTLGAAGVKLSGDGDGALTILGLGDGYDESLTINLDDTENWAVISSATGVTNIDFYNTAGCGFTAHTNNDSTAAPYFALYHEDTSGATAVDTVLGTICFQADDTNDKSTGAIIQAIADADWGGSDTDAPTRLQFKTCPDASSTLVTALTIDSNSYVGIGSTATAPSYKLDVRDDRASSYVFYLFNDGNDANRGGFVTQCGADDGTGTTYYWTAYDGNGDTIGYVANTAGTFALTDVSDIATKKNVIDTKIEGIKTIKDIKVREFERKNDSGKKINGFVAQELQEVYPDAVTVGPDGLLGISKEALIPVLIKCIQEQQVQIDDLSSKIEALTDRIEALEQ